MMDMRTPEQKQAEQRAAEQKIYDDNKGSRALGYALTGGIFLICLMGIVLRPEPKRPDVSQMTEENFKNTCNDDFEKNCKGKFVIWDADVYITPEGKTVRIKKNDHLYDLITNLSKDEASKLYINNYKISGGANITFSGYVKALNWSIPDIDDVRILKINRTAQQALDVNSNKAAEKSDRDKQSQRDDARPYAAKWGVSVDNYLHAKEVVERSGSECKRKVAEYKGLESSEWESRSWLGEDFNSWRMEDESTVLIQGNNMRTKNIGLPKVLNYQCRIRVTSGKDRPQSVEVTSVY